MKKSIFHLNKYIKWKYLW